MKTLIHQSKSVTKNVRRAMLYVVVASSVFVVHGSALAQSTMPGHAAMAAPQMSLHAAMENMQKKMSAMTMTGKMDVDFAMMMVAHHQAAIDMAKAELESGKDSAMRATAKKVIAAQTKEIAQLQAWLKKNHQPM